MIPERIFYELARIIWPDGPENFWTMFFLLCGVAVLAYLWQRHHNRKP
jgi:hypothetical protein